MDGNKTTEKAEESEKNHKNAVLMEKTESQMGSEKAEIRNADGSENSEILKKEIEIFCQKSHYHSKAL